MVNSVGAEPGAVPQSQMDEAEVRSTSLAWLAEETNAKDDLPGLAAAALSCRGPTLPF